MWRTFFGFGRASIRMESAVARDGCVANALRPLALLGRSDQPRRQLRARKPWAARFLQRLGSLPSMGKLPMNIEPRGAFTGQITRSARLVVTPEAAGRFTRVVGRLGKREMGCVPISLLLVRGLLRDARAAVHRWGWCLHWEGLASQFRGLLPPQRHHRRPRGLLICPPCGRRLSGWQPVAGRVVPREKSEY